MSDVNRRQAVKLAAAGIAVAGAGTGMASAKEQSGEYRRAPEKRWAGHKTADAKELEQSTLPYPVKVGVEPPGDRPFVEHQQFIADMKTALAPMGTQPAATFWSGPRTDLNGLRLKLPNRPEIYLIDRGYRRWIPNPATYNNLFRDWNGVVVDIDVNEIPVAVPISNGAILARAIGTAPVYLIDQGEKRWIVAPAIMDQYYFNWGRVHDVPHAFLDSIRAGSNIDG